MAEDGVGGEGWSEMKQTVINELLFVIRAWSRECCTLFVHVQEKAQSQRGTSVGVLAPAQCTHTQQG